MRVCAMAGGVTTDVRTHSGYRHLHPPVHRLRPKHMETRQLDAQLQSEVIHTHLEYLDDPGTPGATRQRRQT